jgi:hypothetical protein
LSVTSDRSVVFSGYSGFLHQWNWPPRYKRNIVENGVKRHKPNQSLIKLIIKLCLPKNTMRVFCSKGQSSEPICSSPSTWIQCIFRWTSVFGSQTSFPPLSIVILHSVGGCSSNNMLWVITTLSSFPGG